MWRVLHVRMSCIFLFFFFFFILSLFIFLSLVAGKWFISRCCLVLFESGLSFAERIYWWWKSGRYTLCIRGFNWHACSSGEESKRFCMRTIEICANRKKRKSILSSFQFSSEPIRWQIYLKKKKRKRKKKYSFDSFRSTVHRCFVSITIEREAG